jgi:hypothetical protein
VFRLNPLAEIRLSHLNAAQGCLLSALWPHLQKALAVCRKETNRNGVTVFTFKADGAGFVGFQTDFS